MKLKRTLSVICTAALLLTSFSFAAVPVSAQTAESAAVSGDDGGGYDEPEEGGEQGDEQDEDAPKADGDTNDPSAHAGLSVNGVVLTEQSSTVQCGEGTASFDTKTNTLTLENAALTKSEKLTESDPGDKKNLAREDSAIYSTLDDLTIVLKGKNTFGTYVIDQNYEEAYNAAYAPNGEMYMVRSSGSVTIKGDGTLETHLMRKENGEYVLTDKECDTRIAVDGNVTFDGITMKNVNVDASLHEEYDDTGVVTLKDSTLKSADIIAPSGFVMKNSSLAVTNKTFNTEFGYVYEHNDVRVWTGDITLENSTLERTQLWGRSSFSGDDRPASSITAKGLTLLGSDVRSDGSISITGLSADSNSEDEVKYHTEKRTLANINRILGDTVTISDSGTARYITIYAETGENADAQAALISGVDIYDGALQTSGDLIMDKAKFAGTKIDVTGNLKMTECTSYAEYENQNSPITVNGEKIDIINCEFGGIAKTNQGERPVYLGNGLPMVETFSYRTLSGVSLSFYSEEDKELTLNLKNSRLMLQRIGTGNKTKINIDETRMLLINSIFGYGDPGYNYDSITLSGNIAIVTGAWGMDNETGIFIDYLGDYFTFDEETGVLCLNNSYGARGWRQRTEYWDNDAREDKIRTEITDKVKKIIVGDDVDWDIGVSFAGYKNVTEIEIGDGVHNIYGDQFDGCVSLKKITFGTGIEYFTDDIFDDCPKLKTIILEGEINSSDYTRESTFDRNDVNLNIIVPSALEEKYKTEIFTDAKNMINRSEDPIYYPLTVNGEILSNDHLTVQCGDGTAKFDPATNTLTLDNAAITKHARVSPSDERMVTNEGLIESRLDDLTIVLKGDNVMKWGEPNAGINGNGIDAWGALTIKGGGTLEIECEEKIYNENYTETKTPILHSNGDIVIDGATIKVTYSDDWKEDPFFGKSYADKLSIESNMHSNEYSRSDITYVQKTITIINSTLNDVDLDPETDKRLRISNSTINGTYFEKDDSVTVPDKKPTVGNIYGDLDGDGDITSNDALEVLRASVGASDLIPEQKELADVDGDGDITSNDALAVLRYSVGMGGGKVGKEIS